MGNVTERLYHFTDFSLCMATKTQYDCSQHALYGLPIVGGRVPYQRATHTYAKARA